MLGEWLTPLLNWFGIDLIAFLLLILITIILFKD